MTMCTLSSWYYDFVSRAWLDKNSLNKKIKQTKTPTIVTTYMEKVNLAQVITFFRDIFAICPFARFTSFLQTLLFLNKSISPGSRVS